MRFTITAFALVFTVSVWADCPDGVYNFTDVDKKFMTDAAAVLQAAVPPAPEGWSLRDTFGKPIQAGAPPIAPPTSSCKGADRVPLGVGYDVKYYWVTGEKDFGQKQDEIRKKMAAVQRTPMAADQQKLFNELGLKDRDLRYKARGFEKTDKAEADRLKAEAAVYANQLNEIRQAHRATLKPQLDALEAEERGLSANTPLEVKFRIVVNSSGVDSRDLKASTAQAGAATTLADAKRTLLLYGGPWKKDTNGSMLGVFQPGAKIQKAYNIYVEAEGDPKQVEALLSKMDGAALKALVGK